MGDLYLEMKYSDTIKTSYYRDLNLTDATASVSYTIGGKKFRRESFISFPNKAFVTSITCSSGRSVSFDAALSSKLHYKIEVIDGNTIALTGKAPYHVAHRDNDPEGQVVYQR